MPGQTSKPASEVSNLKSEISTADAARTDFEECWNRIGVHGDGTCPELARHVHCRNCPVHARAGAWLLNRDIPSDYRRQWTGHYARAKHRAAAWDTSVIIFRLGSEWFALDTTLLQEIAEHRPMHSLPHRRMGIVLGLVNVRGELLLLVALSRLLQPGNAVPEISLQRHFHRLLVIGTDANRFAFPVDEVHGVHRFNQEDLEPPPVTMAQAGRSFTRGLLRWRQHTVGCLDADALFFHLNRSLA